MVEQWWHSWAYMAKVLGRPDTLSLYVRASHLGQLDWDGLWREDSFGMSVFSLSLLLTWKK